MRKSMETVSRWRGKSRRRYERTGMVRAFWVLLAFLTVGMLLGEPGTRCASAKKKSGSWSNSDGWKGYSFSVKGGEEQDLQVKVSVGFDGNKVAANQYSTVTAEIRNQGADFSGYFQIFVPDSLGTSVMFQRAVSVAGGETKRVTFLFKALRVRSSFTVALCDENGGRWGQKNIPVDFINTVNCAWIGTLSDDTSGLGYLSSKDKTDVVPLNPWNILSDARAIETLDILVINDYDTQKLSQQQVDAIGTWVRQGGTLVLGTGAQAEKTLKAFSGNLLQGSIGQVKKITTGFGGSEEEFVSLLQEKIEEEKQEKLQKVEDFLTNMLSEQLYGKYSDEISNLEQNSDILKEDGEIYQALRREFSEEELREKLAIQLTGAEEKKIGAELRSRDVSRDITQLTIQNAKGILTEGKETIVSRLDCGEGSVLVTEFDLNLENSSWDSHGALLRDLVFRNLNAERKEEIEGSMSDSDMDYYEDTLGQGLQINEVSGLPNLKLYGALLLVYVALVGPVYYLVLRRMKKRGLLWGLIPLTAVVFSVMIYFIGISTRIQQSYINYLSQVRLTDREERELETQFSITNANNRPYTVEVAENAKIGPVADEDDITSDRSNDTYKYGVEYHDQKTTLHMDALSAFESARLEDRQSVKMSGKIEFTDLSLDDASRKMSGIVTNGLSYDLEDCILVIGSNVIRLGEINQGESISLEELDFTEAYLNFDDGFDLEMWTDEVFGVDSYTAENPRASRKSALLRNYYLSMNVSEGFFYGFLQQGQETEFTKLFDYAKYGETAVLQELSNQDIMGREGVETIGKLSEYASAQNVGVHADMTVDPSTKEVAVTYDLSALQKKYKKLSLRYRGMENKEFQSDYSEKKFLGDVCAVNQKTGKTEVLMQSGKETEITDLKKYIGGKGRLILRYRFDADDEEEYEEEYEDLCIPTLILEGRNS